MNVVLVTGSYSDSTVNKGLSSFLKRMEQTKMFGRKRGRAQRAQQLEAERV